MRKIIPDTGSTDEDRLDIFLRFLLQHQQVPLIRQLLKELDEEE